MAMPIEGDGGEAAFDTSIESKMQLIDNSHLTLLGNVVGSHWNYIECCKKLLCQKQY